MDKVTYRLGDDVISRIAQCLQESILLGIDIVDLLRSIVLNETGGVLSLDEDYTQKVFEEYNRLVENAKHLSGEALTETHNDKVFQ